MNIYKTRLNLLDFGLMFLFLGLFILIVSFTAAPEQYQICTISMQASIDGNMDLNIEKYADVSEFSLNTVQGNVTITAPCNWLRNQGYTS